jgi:TolB-like protein/DNA-binding winged helix-turn-helix (wHTH) protein
MADPAPPPRLIRFGVFELDLESGELRKHGLKIKLQEQPYQILAMLLERPGRVVTREELQKKLWPADTFVDFDNSLNTGINKIREALSDSADNPRFVETLPRRGYRFICPLAAMSSSPVGGGDAAATVGAIHESRLQKRSLLAFGGLALVALAAVLVALNVAGLRERALRSVGAVRETPLQIQSIAVLPLENLSGDPEQEYFADGMTDELITTLGKISALRVISRTSALHYKGTKKTLPEIAKELNVDAIVEGSVRRFGNRVRITANLLYAPGDRHLWAESYERDLQDVLALQSEAARAIADEVRIKLTADDQARLATVRPVNPEAYEAYLKGLQARWRGPMSGVPAAYFKQAVEKDPTYAPAFAALSRTYTSDMGLPYEEGYPLAASAAAKALDLDNTLAAAHAAEAAINLRFRWDWPKAESGYRRAIELNPSNTDSHIVYGRYLTLMGRFDEALATYRRAIELDPFNLLARFSPGWVYGKAHRYDEAIPYLRDVVEVDPTWMLAPYELAHAYARQGMYLEAVAEAEKAKCWSDCGWLYAVAGRREEARAILNELIQDSEKRYVDPGFIAFTYAGLGDRDRALGWLEEGYRRRSQWMIYLKVTPEVDPLRSDPRFQAILRRMNFPP